MIALAAATVAAFGMFAIRGILAPVLLTLILTVCAYPVRTRLMKRGVNAGLATGALLVVLFGILAAFTAVVLVAVGQFLAMLPEYAGTFQEIGANVGVFLPPVFMIYPIIVLVIMLLPSVRLAFGGGSAAPEPEDYYDAPGEREER